MIDTFVHARGNDCFSSEECRSMRKEFLSRFYVEREHVDKFTAYFLRLKRLHSRFSGSWKPSLDLIEWAHRSFREVLGHLARHSFYWNVMRDPSITIDTSLIDVFDSQITFSKSQGSGYLLEADLFSIVQLLIEERSPEEILEECEVVSLFHFQETSRVYKGVYTARKAVHTLSDCISENLEEREVSEGEYVIDARVREVFASSDCVGEDLELTSPECPSSMFYRYYDWMYRYSEDVLLYHCLERKGKRWTDANQIRQAQFALASHYVSNRARLFSEFGSELVGLAKQVFDEKRSLILCRRAQLLDMTNDLPLLDLPEGAGGIIKTITADYGPQFEALFRHKDGLSPWLESVIFEDLGYFDRL